MTREECTAIVRAVVSLYPNWHPNSLTDTVNAWFLVLQDFSAKSISAAVVAYNLKGNEFAPNPGQLVNLIASERHREMTSLEAWDKVLRAIRNSTYNSKQEFEALPVECQKALGGAETLRTWARVNEESLPSIQANFVKSSQRVLARESSMRLIPPRVREQLQGSSKRVMIGNGN